MRSVYLILLGILLYSTTYGQWQSLGGPSGDGVTDLLRLGNTWLLGTPNGVFRSSDQGSTWQMSGNDLRNVSIAGLARQGTSIFAFSATENKLYRSEDNGVSWLKVPANNLPGGSFHQITATENALYISTPEVYRSLDGGLNWSICAIPGPLVYYYTRMISLNTELLVVAPFNGVYRSSDDGASWSKLTSSMPGLPIAATASSSRLWVAYNAGATFKVAQSADWGNTWSIDPNTLQWNVDEMAMDNQYVYLISGLNIYRRAQNNGNWMSVAAPNAAPFTSLTNVDIPLKVKLFYADGILFATAKSGLYRSTNFGQTWQEISNGLVNTAIKRLIRSGDILFTNAGSGLFKRSNTLWEVQTGNPSPETQIFALSEINGSVYAGAQYRLWVTNDQGQHWFNSAPPTNEYTEVAAAGNQMLVGCSDGIYRSEDNGASWLASSDGMLYQENGVWSNPYILCVKNYGDITWASSEKRLFRSINQGQHWELIDSLHGAQRLYLHENRLFRVLDGQVMLSLDQGASWGNLVFPVTDKVLSLAFSNDRWFAGTRGGVLMSDDAGQSWSFYGQGFPEKLWITELLYDNGQLLAGTGTEGVWLLYLNATQAQAPHVPGLKIGLYPNPASTDVQLELPDAGEYRCEIWDANGQLQWRAQVQGPSARVALAGWQAGMYCVRVSKSGKELRSLLLHVQP
jgi:photosystem II stability/assembly factor-like uncharacterized protein